MAAARGLDPAHDMAKLAEAVRGLPPVRLLILDPVVAAVTGDSHKNTETRRGLQPVVGLAAELGCAVLGITHLSKNSSGREPLDRVTGSVAFGAVARVVLATVKAAIRMRRAGWSRQVEPRPRYRRLCLHAGRAPVPGTTLTPRVSSGASRWKARRAS